MLEAGSQVVMELAQAQMRDGKEVLYAMVTDPEGNWIELSEGDVWSKPTWAPHTS